MKSDTQLQQDVLAELAWEPAVNAAQIGVAVIDGIATLTGHVDSYAEKWAAERAAQRVAGMRALAVEVTVALPGTSKRNDVDIARAAENVLQWIPYWPKDGIKVMVESGWITLSGEVNWEYQRQVAERGVRHLMGVTGLSNQILIKENAPSSIVKAGIEAALKRRGATDARRISVEIHGDQVTLSGTANTWLERDLAKNAAWGAPGVRNVVDHIAVSS